MMPSSTTENQRLLDRLQARPVHGIPQADLSLAAWISQPGVLVSVLAIACGAAYQLAQSRAASRGQQLPTVAELLWNSLVFITPAFLLYAVDRWVNPPAFPIPMLQSQPTTHAAKSDVLRRILRVDQPGGIVASVSEAGRRAYTNTFSGLKGGSSQPAGLGNWDNSCFQNSVLQGLASLRHLPRYLTGLAPGSAARDGDTSTTAGALRAFAADLNDASNNGKTLFTPAVLKNMSTIQQQDAQEYFSRLMDQVDKDIEKGARAAYRPPGFEAEPSRDDAATSQHSDDSGYQSLPVLSKAGSELMTIRNPLEGLSAQRVACTACGYSEGLSMIPFNCLTLNFEVGVEQYDLFELLDNYVQLESIFSVDCVKCTLLEYRRSLQHLAAAVPAAADRLNVVEAMLEDDDFDDASFKRLRIPDAKKVSSTKTKQVAIGRPPRSLVLHMNRSVFDPVTFRSYKNTAAVQFPKTLDLGPWCVGSAEGVRVPTETTVDGDGPAPAKGRDDQEQWVLNATASMVAGDAHPSRISGPIYELRAVVTHYGRHENGHYVCYRKHPVSTSTSIRDLKPQDETARPPNLVGDGQADDVDSIHEDEQDEAATAAADPQDPYSKDTDAQWWRLSDETVTQVSERDVLMQGGVFMLFYDCTDPNSILVTPGETLEADDAGEASTTAVEGGPKSPSWSDASVATLCNAPTSGADGVSEVSSVALATEEEQVGSSEPEVVISEMGPAAESVEGEPRVLVVEREGEDISKVNAMPQRSSPAVVLVEEDVDTPTLNVEPSPSETASQPEEVRD